MNAARLLLLAIAIEVGWFFYMSNQAGSDPDVTLGGAYCTVWMLGMPFVALLALAIEFLISSVIKLFGLK